MPTETILQVAVPTPLRRLFDYLPPASTAAPDPSVLVGARVLVPLGQRKVVGVVMGVAATSELAPERLRRALEFLDDTPLLPADVRELCRFAAGYYHAPIGEVLAAILPAGLRARVAPRERNEHAWQATAAAHGLPPGAPARAPRQAAALDLLRSEGALSARACRERGISGATLRALAERGLVASAAAAPPLPLDTPPDDAAPPLNPGQAAAFTALDAARGRYACFVLEGVTGSGKTEVYLRFIAQVLAAGHQVLVLVPEIGLTPQAWRRVSARFGSAVGLLHSGRTDRERLAAWHDAASGRTRVLIGTRSALFCPLPRLGAIIVDEEHDASFKQQDGFRYSARDLAVFRARQWDIPVVLGSATPATETLANCDAGRFTLLQLPQRAGTARPPTIELLDIRGKALDGGMADSLLARIARTLASGHQALVFLNRRGWAPVLSCADCGWMAECDHCDARMTLHRTESRLWCHHCDAKRRVPTACPDCRGTRLQAVGNGTERSEHALQKHFPAYPIRRIDRGTMGARGAMEALITELEREEPCILVGTQMLAKGHHFPRVTLVALLDVDGGLFSADLRAAERTGQLIVQVAGRAGRAELPGDVLIQTMHPTHPWLQRLVSGGYRAFIDPLLAERRAHGLPPFSHLAVLRTESAQQQVATDALLAVRALLREAGHAIESIGPLPATLQRRAGQFRMQLLLRACSRAALHAALAQACSEFEARHVPGLQRWAIDVDPVDGV